MCISVYLLHYYFGVIVSAANQVETFRWQIFQNYENFMRINIFKYNKNNHSKTVIQNEL